MSDATPGPAGDPLEAEDPLAADKRTLTIGAIAMIGLIIVGVVSAQLFARGGCVGVVEPRAAAALDEDVAPTDAVNDALGSVDARRVIADVEQLAASPVAAAVPVGETDGVVALEDGLLTTGPTVTSLDGSLVPVATFDTDDPVVGDGAAVYDVVVPNDVTGQTDAIVPLSGPELTVGGCVDTAVVGSAFAFLLGADEGQLLLFRAEEDGDQPTLELRDATGRRWQAPIEQPAGPPGTLAERLSGELGPDVVVAARRVGPQEETGAPAVVAVDREDGAVRFEVAHDTLAQAAQLDGTVPIRWEVAAVGTDTALVHGRPDPSEAAEDDRARDGSLVLLDLDAGEAITAVTGIGPLRAAAATPPAATVERHAVATAHPSGPDDEVLVLDADGALTSVGNPDGDVTLAWAGDDLLIVGPTSLSRVTADPAGGDTYTLAEDVTYRGLAVTADGRIAVLVTARDASDAVLLVTTRSDGPVTDPDEPGGA